MCLDNINHLHSGLITQLSAQEDHNAKHDWTQNPRAQWITG